ncbi:Cof-type HAD-IIB family hydrolase [Glycomyces sp. TRM65418]|uniref:HAD family hydrolase n=1 Tax=Glycomyces sp. TRM65418 TaxID=2867006 RepID=UPI001CE5A4FC|nr:HAD family hydrolase [Glycomyces sp. TRM65418]MCC3764015.1 Cof-type HAD-IIB family hydrolase [Glycomyces sp. TRM65418]QZD53708.1 Cof-type HAD-IIB family hydrolase [Glycomyces sp. TRM65418]
MPDNAPAPRQTPPKLVAVDLDGTVVDYHDREPTKPSRAVIDALRAVRDAGVPVAVVTGRAIWGAVRTADDLGLDDGFASASHGAGEYDLAAREISHQSAVDAATAVAALRDADPAVEFAVEWDLDGWWHTPGFKRDFDARWAGEITLDELVSRPAPRLVARVDSDNRYGAAIRCANAMRLAERAALGPADYHVEVGYNGWVDIGPPGISKATGIARIADYYGVSSADTVVFGDAHNDLTMFAWAGYAVAMGQAAPDVRAAADEVAPSVWEDGVAKVLARWF